MPALSEQTSGTAQERTNDFVIALTASGSLSPTTIPVAQEAVITMNNAGATTYTLTAATVASYPIGYKFRLISIGAGTCTLTGSGVTFNGRAAAVATATGVTVIKTAPTVWSII